MFPIFLETVSTILPRISRMTHERTTTKSEQSTENSEVPSDMVPVPSATSKAIKIQSNKTTGDILNQHLSGDIKKSAFVSVRRKTSPTSLGNVNLREKRKFESMTLENHVSEENFKDAVNKRFKSDQLQNIHNRNGLLYAFKPPVYFRENSVHNNQSIQQNAYLTLNALNGVSMDVSRKPVLNSVTSDISKHLNGFKKERRNAKEMKTSNSQTNPAEHMGIKSTPHAEQTVAPFSKTPQWRASVEPEKEEKNFTSSSPEFISLDSTKSSFLTLIKDMRENAECKLIPCPYCERTFAKYLDLKNHVQVHKYVNGLPQDQRVACENKSPVSTTGNSMFTPVSSRAACSPRPPSRRQSIDGVLRATSVIQFAEKKSKDKTGK